MAIQMFISRIKCTLMVLLDLQNNTVSSKLYKKKVTKVKKTSCQVFDIHSKLCKKNGLSCLLRSSAVSLMVYKKINKQITC